ncbi:AMP-binding protein [Tistrella sp. BH-R2-4]|uniref:AMP-binding protein n=1 Tax=Tistrella arctica TaxID=3133430 RepID=A0ABU9YDY1_9PROT
MIPAAPADTAANSLHAIIQAALARNPDTIVIDWHGGPVTAAALRARAAGFAAALVSLGVAPGDRVAARVEKSPDAIALFLGTLMAGAVFLPLNTAYTVTELAWLLGDAEPAVFITDPAAIESCRPAVSAGVAMASLGSDGSGDLAARASQASAPAPVACGPDAPAAILYTSGTTGRPKGAVLSHRNLTANIQALCRAWAITDRDVLLHALPLFHAHGLFVAAGTLLAAGGRMILLPKFDAATVRDRLPEATLFMGVPTFYARLLDLPGFGADDCRHLRLAVAGSAPLGPDLFRRFHAATGHAVLERYGATEMSIAVANPLDGERRPGSIGYPLPGCEARVVAPDDAPLPTGTAGELQIRGPNVFTGYWRRPDATTAAFTPDGFFRTGDLAVAEADGRLAIVGRSKDLIITGGYNVYPREVEIVLDDLDGVGESAVIGLPHPDFGEAVTAVIEASAGGAAPAEAEVIGHLRSELAAYKCPKRVIVVDRLPRNTMGKVEKARLRVAYAALYG